MWSERERTALIGDVIAGHVAQSGDFAGRRSRGRRFGHARHVRDATAADPSRSGKFRSFEADSSKQATGSNF
ncbi:hypothetical protein GEV33_000218 [Tenebrio molitor]|uniref:Uncharacterized protein n=1 Tax=Tenebrio molitor TaxID=7067 RepID=A0A8J6HZX5_TENMO|nr:hypothetical protein GEV33_000218 [Tenebrio molitor]